MNNVKATQTGNGNLGVDKGKLRIAVTSEITSYPVAIISSRIMWKKNIIKVVDKEDADTEKSE